MWKFDGPCSIEELRGSVGACILKLRSTDLIRIGSTRSSVHARLDHPICKEGQFVWISRQLRTLVYGACKKFISGTARALVSSLLLEVSSQVIDQLSATPWTLLSLLQLFIDNVLSLL